MNKKQRQSNSRRDPLSPKAEAKLLAQLDAIPALRAAADEDCKAKARNAMKNRMKNRGGSKPVERIGPGLHQSENPLIELMKRPVSREGRRIQEAQEKILRERLRACRRGAIVKIRLEPELAEGLERMAQSSKIAGIVPAPREFKNMIVCALIYAVWKWTQGEGPDVEMRRLPLGYETPLLHTSDSRERAH